MNFKTRNDGASAPADGQAQPLPLPREGEGRAAPLPTPRAGDGRATPLPVAPHVDDAPDDDDPPSPTSHETYSITKPALDYYYDRAEGHFARFNNMSVAFKLAGRDLKARIVKTGRVFDLKPPTAFESYLESRALRTRSGAPQEASDVAARRRDWDEAKRSGDAGAMTTSANALMRAVEEARGHLDVSEVLVPKRDHNGLDVISLIKDMEPGEPEERLRGKGVVRSPSLLTDAYATAGEHLFVAQEANDVAQGPSLSPDNSEGLRGAERPDAETMANTPELSDPRRPQPAGPRPRGTRPADRDVAEARALAGQLPINGSREPTPVWYVRTTPDGPLTVVSGNRFSRTDSSAERGGPPPGTVMGGHGHVRKRRERGLDPEIDDYNEAQGYPGPGDFAAVMQTGIPEIVRTPDRIIIIYVENGRPVAEVVSGAPFPPNVPERIERNKYMKENMGGQGWTFRNGPPPRP